MNILAKPLDDFISGAANKRIVLKCFLTLGLNVSLWYKIIRADKNSVRVPQKGSINRFKALFFPTKVFKSQTIVKVLHRLHCKSPY